MYDPARRRAKGRIAFLAFFVSLFMFFTPFEQSGLHPSMFPKYFAAGFSALALVPLLTISRVRIRAESQLALVMLCMILFHSFVVKPVPFHFTLLITLNTLLAVLVYEASFAWRAEFVSAVGCLLLLNITFISAQALLFYVKGSPIIDFHKMIFGSDSRFAEDYMNIARFSGLQVEPGTYANYMGALTAILVLASEFNARFLVTFVLAVVSVFVTNSGSSMYFVPVLVMLFGYIWRSKIRASHILLLIGAIAAYLVFSGVVAHLEDRFLERDDASLSHRIDGVHAWTSLALDDKLIGIGFGSDPCVRCFYQDIGVVFNLLTRGGLIVTLAFVVMLGRMLLANGPVLALLLILVPINEKMFFYDASIWLFFLFAMTRYVKTSAEKRQLPSTANARTV